MAINIHITATDALKFAIILIAGAHICLLVLLIVLITTDYSTCCHYFMVQRIIPAKLEAKNGCKCSYCS